MSARSFGRPGGSASALQQPGATAAASAAGEDAGSDQSPGSDIATPVKAVSVPQAGAFPVRQGSTGMLRPGLMPAPLGNRRYTKQLSSPLLGASTALQLTGSPYGCPGESAAGECEHLLRSRHSSSGGDKDVMKTSVDLPQLSDSIAAPYVADSDGDCGLRISAVKPKHSTTAWLGNT